MSLGAKRRRREARVYHAPELVAVERTDEAREGLRAERARLLGLLAAVEAALREMGDA